VPGPRADTAGLPPPSASWYGLGVKPLRAVAVAAVVLLAGACANSRTPARGDDRGTTSGPAGDAAAPAEGPPATVVFDTPAGPVTVGVEVVKSAGMVQRGLMYRKFLPLDRGMLFMMDEDDHWFWMKNTFIPLDIVFIGRDLRVVGILRDMRPHDTESKHVGQPSIYILEVNAGWAREHAVDVGTAVALHDVEAAAR